jgi:hypothetical protein
MKNKDTIALAEAYQVIEEGRFKSALAAAAMGLGTMAGHGQSMDDLADRANPHLPESPKTTTPTESEESNYHKALVAFEKAKKEKIVDDVTLSKIALDQNIAKRYAIHLMYLGYKIPNIIKQAIGGYARDLENAFSSNSKN